jgi:glycosyltransferase involved in cell wall biosynthesis
MRVLVLHNTYTQAGGEDSAVDEEIHMLRERILDVSVIRVINRPDTALTVRQRVTLGYSSIWSQESYSRVLSACHKYRPDVAHVHNFWTTLSPSIHKACHDAGVATVQTLHNYRLLCVNAMMFRDGKVCEDCLNKVPWRGVVRRCYRGSIGASTAVATMVTVHRIRGTWEQDVDLLLTPSEHARARLLSGYIPADRILVKPNVIEDVGECSARPSEFSRAIYIGRLSKEKGLRILLSAWAEAGFARKGKLLIVGDGPEAASLRSFARSRGLCEPQVAFAGAKSRSEARALLAESRMLVLPSLSEETFGNCVIEAFSAGKAAVVSDSGALGELVENGRTGYKVCPGDSKALANAIGPLLTDNALADTLGRQARERYLSRYTTEQNYRTLMKAYRAAMERRASAEKRLTQIGDSEPKLNRILNSPKEAMMTS